jgi:glycosyltransferase involved in cell wall biosynthesis
MTNQIPLVSIVLPAFNEASILSSHLLILVNYLETEQSDYRWELVIVNDGSSDDTGRIAEDFAAGRNNVLVVHHKINYGLGQALKFGMGHTRGDYIVTMDIDLSYSPDHITRLVEALRTSRAKLVLASPYMKGGQISNVPLLRKILSVGANWFLSLVAHGRLSTLTCMVRGYDGEYGRNLILRGTGMEIMPETVYKSMILRAGIHQIPAHLDWGLQVKQQGRQSSMRIIRHMLSTVLSGFVFRPFMFFIVPGLLLFGFSLWVNIWMLIHFFEALQMVPADAATDNISWAIAKAYQDYPHTFIVGLLTLMLAVQLISLGILALQSKSYFEEVFYLGSAIERRVLSRKSSD